MGLFDRFENKIEGAVNGVFARAFKGDVQPVEIAARLQRELDAEAKLLSRDKRLVPNEFTVQLSQHDYDRLVPYSKTLTSEIVPELREHAAERHYVFNGPISIAYEMASHLPTGRFTVTSAAVAGIEQADGPASTTMIRRSTLVLEVNGVRHPLTAPGLLIGRGSEADLRINDPGVSRRHAQIHVRGTGDDIEISIEDLGSTNGIIVNGTKTHQAQLDDGSRIEIGSTRMLVHSPVGA
ncbi:FhaA domain-containing protein [Luteococcus sp. OSA5]|uniref:FhaA domain-containing protein n=1 Tax=Luteococcus sp. OSA5 TaxID=3401630 RepID=UPI003B43D5DC